MAVSINDLPARRGHFLLESGYHTDIWLTLDALFVSPRQIAPLVMELAERLRRYTVGAICGPLLGGAFLAYAVASALDLDFYVAEPVDGGTAAGLFEAQYSIPAALRKRLSGQRVAVVDDAISAGSSVRATIDTVTAAGGSTLAVGTILLLGTVARDHFATLGVPLESLVQRDLTLWHPDECPLCHAGTPLEDLLRTSHPRT